MSMLEVEETFPFQVVEELEVDWLFFEGDTNPSLNLKKIHKNSQKKSLILKNHSRSFVRFSDVHLTELFTRA